MDSSARKFMAGTPISWEYQQALQLAAHSSLTTLAYVESRGIDHCLTTHTTNHGLRLPSSRCRRQTECACPVPLSFFLETNQSVTGDHRQGWHASASAGSCHAHSSCYGLGSAADKYKSEALNVEDDEAVRAAWHRHLELTRS
jgi:hypothetical protein